MTTTRLAYPAVGVRDIMRHDVITIPDGATLFEAARTLWQRGIGGAPVVDANGGVIGVISMRDLLAPGVAGPELPVVAEAASRREPSAGGDRLATAAGAGTRVRDVMTRARFSVRADATLPELARFLLSCDTHRALVMDGDRLLGIVTSSDVLRALATA